MSRSSTFSPLAHRAFLLILVGSLLSNFGNAIQSVGAAWQLTIMHQPADVIALVQTATNLPIMLLALPAGAWADMVDKRTIMLLAQTGMLAMSLLLVALAFAGMTPPATIIVPRAELAAAVALNILAFNVARSLGPAIGGAIVSLGGAASAFVANAASYLMVIAVLWRWRPEP